MTFRATFAVIAVLASASSNAADADFMQNFCTQSDRGNVTIQLSSLDRASRTLDLASPSSGGLVFKGTTLSDMKWLADYADFREVLYLAPKPQSVVGLLVLVSREGSRKRIGWVSPACWALVEAVLRGAVPTRAQSGGL